ncbi:NIF3 family protein [Mycobacterium kansasii 824]|nr:NIF3 family protein [Mycobacterium kansasii 824]
MRLADVIEVLDQAYPPRLAESWDSVGLVCGDPADVVDSVTVAVDATAAVVDEVPEGACCWPIIRCCCAGSIRLLPARPRVRSCTA